MLFLHVGCRESKKKNLLLQLLSFSLQHSQLKMAKRTKSIESNAKIAVVTRPCPDPGPVALAMSLLLAQDGGSCMAALEPVTAVAAGLLPALASTGLRAAPSANHGAIPSVGAQTPLGRDPSHLPGQSLVGSLVRGLAACLPHLQGQKILARPHEGYPDRAVLPHAAPATHGAQSASLPLQRPEAKSIFLGFVHFQMRFSTEACSTPVSGLTECQSSNLVS